MILLEQSSESHLEGLQLPHAHSSTSLGVPGTTVSQERRPTARCAAVSEASEASRDADVAVAHAHAQQYGGLGAGKGRALALERLRAVTSMTFHDVSMTFMTYNMWDN